MKSNNLHNIKNLVTAIAVTLFFSCKNDFNKVQKVGVLQNQPIGEAKNIDLKYTELKEFEEEEEERDSVVLLANLISPKMLDYSNRNFAFSEFPDGIELKVYDDDNNKTTITARYAIFYTETDVIDLRGNVVIATHTKDTLFTEQLYYNQKMEWVFTDSNFTYKTLTSMTDGFGFDSDKTFIKYQIHEMGADFELDN